MTDTVVENTYEVSISSPSSEGGGLSSVLGLVVPASVSISSPSSEGGGKFISYDLISKAMAWFPLVLLQAKVVGKFCQHYYRCRLYRFH